MNINEIEKRLASKPEYRKVINIGETDANNADRGAIDLLTAEASLYAEYM
jgi:hypothetical protein